VKVLEKIEIDIAILNGERKRGRGEEREKLKRDILCSRLISGMRKGAGFP